jgi:hypothetical protein
MKVIMFEGTPEEFSAASPALKSSLVSPIEEARLGDPAETLSTGSALRRSTSMQEARLGDLAETGTDRGRFVTEDEACKILSWREISDAMRKVLVALRLAGDQIMSSEDLRKVAGYDADQFRGMMGAFGRRISKAVGKDLWFFRKDWDAAKGHQNWRSLPPSVIQAMDKLGIR